MPATTPRPATRSERTSPTATSGSVRIAAYIACLPAPSSAAPARPGPDRRQRRPGRQAPGAGERQRRASDRAAAACRRAQDERQQHQQDEQRRRRPLGDVERAGVDGGQQQQGEHEHGRRQKRPDRPLARPLPPIVEGASPPSPKSNEFATSGAPSSSIFVAMRSLRSWGAPWRAFALMVGVPTAAGRGAARPCRPTPSASSPAGVIYQIPLNNARRNAAPVLPGGSHGGGPGGGGGPGSAPRSTPKTALDPPRRCPASARRRCRSRAGVPAAHTSAGSSRFPPSC